MIEVAWVLVLISASQGVVSAEAVQVGTFPQEVGATYAEGTGLPSTDVFDVAVSAGDEVYAGTVAGLARFTGERWVPVTTVGEGPIPLLARHGDGVLATANGALFEVAGDDAKRVADLPGTSATLLHGLASGDEVLLGTADGLFTLEDGRFVRDERLDALLGADKSVRQVAAGPNGEAAVAADAGLFRRVDGTWEAVYPGDGNRSWAPRDVRGVAYDGQGRLWFASPQGVGRFDGTWTLFAGEDGLPYNQFTEIAISPDGAVWFGTARGAIRFDGDRWAYREGKRWLPDNRVRGVAVTAEGHAWFATSAGVGLIERRPMTLAEKARFYDDEIDKYHKRTPYGYVLSVNLVRPGDKTEVVRHDSDNDGQWTGMYGAAQCFAYAATGSLESKRRAKDAFEAMRFLVKVTEGGSHPAPRGFPARAILPTSGPDPNEDYTLEKDQREQETGDALWKVMHPRWPTSEDGKWYWKCDTSSDELDGHFFFYAQYYDLVADTPEEKDRVRDVVDSIAGHLLENDFHLIDWDGKPTRWANFDPKSLNQDPNWFEERGLNSMSVLSYLAVAHHVTGDPKYRKAADMLIEDHNYAVNQLAPKIQTGPGSGIQFDDEMAFMNYYNLIRLGSNEEARRLYVGSLLRYWRLEEPERNPFYAFTYAACCQGRKLKTSWGEFPLSPSKRSLEVAVDTLERYPMNLVDWRLTNSHRLDIVPLSPIARTPGDKTPKGNLRDGMVLPIDERFIDHWSDDPWALDTGGNGMQLTEGSPFLLAYYMGLYHGLIVEE